MAIKDRFLATITRRSRAVIAVMLVLTLVLGSGITMVDDDSSLDQFETDSPELEKLEYVEDNFGADDDNTTAVQIVIRDENTLDRESLIATLELQEDLRANTTVNESLDEEPFNDLAMVIAQISMVEERQEGLDERAAQLENESAELEADAAALEEDRAELEARAGFLTETLNETRELQIAHDSGELNASERDEQIDALREESAENLTDEQFAAFEPLIEDVRATQEEMNEVQGAYEAGEMDEPTYESRMAELEEEMAASYEAIETQVLGPAFADLQARGEELEDRGEELDERGAELQEDYEALATFEPSTEEAIAHLESMSDEEVASQVESTLDEDADSGLFVFLPTDYEPGETQADARMLIVNQVSPTEADMGGEAADSIVDSQLAMQSIVQDRFDEGFVFGNGIITDEMNRSLGDSMVIVLPLALLFVTIVLIIAYRDLLDILLGVVGIVFVLLWTFGFMGWADIPFTIVMIAVPVLLVGLSIDYAIHVFMRHREQRTLEGDSTRRAMFVALGGVGLALIWVTATAVIGFLSNLISPIGPLRDFGISSAFGIIAALLIFGVLIPAIKLETDDFLEARGFDREKRAFGTGGGPFTSLLSFGQRAAGRIPWVIVLITLLLTVGGVAGAAQVDTAFEQEDFIADDPPEWMDHLPEPIAPGEYNTKANLEYVNEHFLRQDAQANILLEGNVTDDRTLERIAAAEDDVAEKDSTAELPDGSADVESPLSTMEAVAAENETFNETFTDADTNGDDIPDQNLTAVYDALFEANEDAASSVVYRVGEGEYEAVQLVVSMQGDASAGEVTEDMRDVASSIDGDGLEVTATGQLIVFHTIETQLFDTVIESLLLTLVAVFAFLMVGYRWMHGSALLGALTLLPIVFAVAWILGTMYLLGIPFNVMTGTITSLTVGLGIAYNIHMSERYMLERRRGRDVLDALYVAVTGTGGALLGSAATTIGAFGVLVFAILPPLQQFGIITGLTILYAFLGSVFVLPSFLVLWSRYLGPPGFTTEPTAAEQDAAIPSSSGDTPGQTD